MNIFSNIAIIMASGYSYNAEEFATAFRNFVGVRKIMKAPLDVREGVITDLKIPTQIKIGESHEVSAIYKGNVKSGYFSLLIVDRDGVKQWFSDDSSVCYKLMDSGKSIRTGRLNFTNGLYESKWKFTPQPPLYKGYAKAVVHIFEDTNVFPLTFLGKNIHLI